MTILSLALALILVGTEAFSPLSAQQVQRQSFSAPSRISWATRDLVPLTSIPDSVRRKVGYQHWKGAAIGGSLGAVVGFALALAARGQCSDCSSDTAPVGQVTVIGAGLGGAFGFLVGLASPRYRWVPAETE